MIIVVVVTWVDGMVGWRRRDGKDEEMDFPA